MLGLLSIMSAIDNRDHVEPFVPERDDGDSFIYTELLNRQRRSGNNKGRLVRTFYHRSRAEFREQLPDIRALCDYTGARAYTRLGLRSWRKVGHKFAAHVLEQVLAENWEGIRHGYSHACGVSTPLVKYWLFDVDDIADATIMIEALGKVSWRETPNGSRTPLVASIPSRRALHLIVVPFDTRALALPASVSLHRDANTNLYIPEGA